MASTQQESSGLYDFLAWLEMNQKRVVIGVVVLILVILAAAIYVWQKRSTEHKANDALFALPNGLMQTPGAPPPSAEAFQKVAQEYPSTEAGERAELMAAGFYFTSGDYNKAKAQFEKFISDHGDSALKPQAVYGIAASLEALNNTDQAIAKYKEVAMQYRGKAVASLANLALGRLYQAQNKPEDAMKIYQEMETSNTPTDVWRGEAAQAREHLLSKYPALAQKYSAPAQEQILEVTTPPEGSTSAPQVKVVSPTNSNKK